MKGSRMRFGVVGQTLALTALLFSGHVSAAIVSLYDEPGGTSGTIAVSVDLINEPGDAVAAMQFDVVYEHDILQFAGITAGSSALEAGKTVRSSVLRDGCVRIVVSGLNQQTISNGPVAGIVFHRVHPSNALVPQTFVVIEELILADPEGDSITASHLDGMVPILIETLPAQRLLTLIAGVFLILSVGSRWSQRRLRHDPA